MDRDVMLRESGNTTVKLTKEQADRNWLGLRRWAAEHGQGGYRIIHLGGFENRDDAFYEGKMYVFSDPNTALDFKMRFR